MLRMMMTATVVRLVLLWDYDERVRNLSMISMLAGTYQLTVDTQWRKENPRRLPLFKTLEIDKD